ncbi:MAG: carbon-phosphorus lyase complex subunit PhnI [Flexistipes sinusarabici]|jgi:alpha-D-ribose 1-methylphosphonate 5-triphosphate synthase subunit PhnI|uniref:Carbon-phosphorus lyase complex subunit PhnI n=1 Tax=Flexistipes sinusarabici TaxID=2352 RepID=A0A5D0MFE8_FLESI|nr:carbon-phosphorus lyase complex subunit PhnI [Flexistipes sinusarabici]TYB32424.1 MAG: carbon-phosphorus lyase complex subunit PhnI [Flexistipes sinusarabici]
MGYVAVKGGEKAIENSLVFYSKIIKSHDKLSDEAIINSLRFAVDRVLSEGSLFTKKLSAKAIKKSGGDLLNAAFYIRAHRSTCQRVGIAPTISVEDIRILRRISSAFKDIKGGQLLGPSDDYAVKLLIDDNYRQNKYEHYDSKDIFLESALTPLREKNLVKRLQKDEKIWDITRKFPNPPYPRSAVQQVMSRGETGSMLAFAYTSMRGYGDVHPTVGDLRIGFAPVYFKHPFLNEDVKIGEIEVTACECAGSFNKDESGEIKLTTGFGFCFGFNETKAIAMSILDLSLYNKAYTTGEKSIADDFDMIMFHIDGIESFGFTNHYKLPHYVTFQSDLQVFNKSREYSKEKYK